ncbi:MAG TPA: S41 family peptidase [Longimicrobiales bacterium]
MKQHARSALFVLALAVTFVLGGFLLPASADQSGPRLFRDVISLVAGRYVDSLDASVLYEKAALGLVEELGDPYSVLYTPEELESFTIAHEGRYGGVGMLVGNQQGVAVVERVFPNTPSEHAGLQVGDRIVAVDGESTEGWPLEKVTGHLKGEPGTQVRVGIARPGIPEPFDVRMERAEIHIPAVPYSMVLDDGTGYIPLLQFSESASEEVEAAVRDLVAKGATRLVLDLRGNGGGIVDDAVEIAGLFLPQGSLVALQWERGGRNREYHTPDAPLAPDVPLVVLIDEWSASASEIVAGALQDHDRAVLVGETSFGKGLIQSAYHLDGGYILKMTTGKWYTPSGRTIHRERELVNGRLVAVRDSAAQDTTLAARPTFRTDGGRTIYGGGGIVPDIVVQPDTLDTAEQAFVKAMVPHSQDLNLTLFDYAFELKSKVRKDFKVTAEMRDAFYRRLRDAGVEVDRELYDGAAAYVNRLIEDRVARMAFGDAEAKRRALADDAPLVRALELLRHGDTQAELIARAARLAGRS